mmetsp:Transcript_52685/g.112416  ORF Transcript_52685/g.112416 Transcript_52685/m.112416 type:complete len:283 (+) Transcript_52685:777-1625(+)
MRHHSASGTSSCGETRIFDWHCHLWSHTGNNDAAIGHLMVDGHSWMAHGFGHHGRCNVNHLADCISRLQGLPGSLAPEARSGSPEAEPQGAHSLHRPGLRDLVVEHASLFHRLLRSSHTHGTVCQGGTSLDSSSGCDHLHDCRRLRCSRTGWSGMVGPENGRQHEDVHHCSILDWHRYDGNATLLVGPHDVRLGDLLRGLYRSSDRISDSRGERPFRHGTPCSVERTLPLRSRHRCPCGPFLHRLDRHISGLPGGLRCGRLLHLGLFAPPPDYSSDPKNAGL